MPYSKEVAQKELMDEIKAEEPGREKSYTDSMRLDELKANDIAMAEDMLLKQCKHWKFPFNKTGAAHIHSFMGIAVDKALRMLGANIIPIDAMRKRNKQAFLDLSAKSVDQLLQKNRVKIETRPYEGEDAWRSGIYIYKDDVLAYFISRPGRYDPSPLALDQTKWLVVKTNVKM